MINERGVSYYGVVYSDKTKLNLNIVDSWKYDLDIFLKEREKYLLYE